MSPVIEQILTNTVMAGKWTQASTVVSDTNYSALPSDQIIAFTTLTAARTVTLTPCGTPNNYKYWEIKDRSGNCSVAISINIASTSGTFDGIASTAISTPCGSKIFRDDGTNFFMHSTFMPSVNGSTQLQKADGNGGLLDAVPGTDFAPASWLVPVTSALTLSLVGSGATGTQISTTKPSTIRCSVSTSTTSTIGGPATSIVLLKTCPTNSVTEGDWTEQGRVESDQTITLAVALQSIQVVKGQINADIPIAWWAKLVNSGTGTHAEAYVTGSKTIYG